MSQNHKEKKMHSLLKIIFLIFFTTPITESKRQDQPSYSVETCPGTEPSLFNVEDFTITGDIKRRNTVEIHYKGEVKKQAVIGFLDIKVYHGILKIEEGKIKCIYPVSPGTFEDSFEYLIAPVTKKGRYHGTVVLKDQENNFLQCFKYEFYVEK